VEGGVHQRYLNRMFKESDFARNYACFSGGLCIGGRGCGEEGKKGMKAEHPQTAISAWKVVVKSSGITHW
jgi:hypothetical protein